MYSTGCCCCCCCSSQIFNETRIASTVFSENNQTTNIMEMRLVGAEYFDAGRQTDMTKVIVDFRSSSKARETNQSVNAVQ